MESVRVAVCIRPLLAYELPADNIGHLTVDPTEKQVRLSTHAFTFDYIYGGRGSPYSSVFDECVAPVVDALFDGYNGTVIAYGQTGSGKTYTMGISCNGEEHGNGIIPKVMDAIFSKVETMIESTEILMKVSFIEVSNKEVHDLLESKKFAQDSLQVRGEVGGNIRLVGVREPEVKTKEEMTSYLQQGSLFRATESTLMNSQSSRTHAVFTISMEQRRKTHSSTGNDVADILVAKLRLVDLAGSDRAVSGDCININKGLLALCNVIKALVGDDKKRKIGTDIPYRDHVLTRILKDSLGGNSKTIMIAWVSPAQTDVRETINTLEYASLARKIQNPATINCNPKTAKIQKLPSQIKEFQPELLYSRGDGPHEEIKILKHEVSLLEASNEELKGVLQEYKQHAIGAEILENKVSSLEASNKELKEMLQECQRRATAVEILKNKVSSLEPSIRQLKETLQECQQHAIAVEILKNKVSSLEASIKELKLTLQEYQQRATTIEILNNKVSSLEASIKELQEMLQECQQHVIIAEVEKDRMIKQIESIQKEKPLDEINTKPDKIKSQSSEDDGTDSRNPYPVGSDIKTAETNAVEKELEHSSLQEKLNRELKELRKRFEQKKLALGSPSTPHDDTLEDLSVSSSRGDSEWVPTRERRKGKARIRKDMPIKIETCKCVKHSKCMTTRCNCIVRKRVCNLSCWCDHATCRNWAKEKGEEAILR